LFLDFAVAAKDFWPLLQSGWRLLLNDLRYALRALRGDASITFIAVITLALAVGASTTVFSVVDAVLLRPLPYPSADRIVFPWRLPPATANVGFDIIPWDRVQFLTFAQQSKTFEHLSAFLGASFNLTGSAEAVRLDGARVSAEFFRALGVSPQLGKTFDRDADEPGRPPEVVLSDRLWRNRFGADVSIIGRPINLDGVAHTVIGVMPAGFAFPGAAGMPGIFTLPAESELWAPLALSRGPSLRGEPSELALIGRLVSAASTQGAQSELDQFADQMDRQIPQAKGWFRSKVTSMTLQLTGETRLPLLLLLAAVGVLYSSPAQTSRT
jgi:putative ABC transport system permease protein